MLRENKAEREQMEMVCIEEMVPKDHILRKIDSAIDFTHIYDLVGDMYCKNKRKETIERVFADAKEKYSMRYTNHRGLSRVTNWVRLKFAAMNLKKYAIFFQFRCISHYVFSFYPLLYIFTKILPLILSESGVF